MSEIVSLDIEKQLHTVDGLQTLCINTSFEEGKISVIYGASGAGKTTVLRMIAGLTRPDQGSIRVNGATWFDSDKKMDLPARKRSIGFVFQDYALFPNMTVRRNIEFALPKGGGSSRVEELLEDAELSSLQHQYPSKLSGGQRQRLALVRALAVHPKLLLLDEPLSALDMEMRFRLQDLILSLKEKYNATILLVSHDIPEIFRLADHVAEIKNCNISQTGRPKEVFDAALLKKQFNIF